METIQPIKKNQALRTLAEKLKVQWYNKSQKLQIIAATLHKLDPEGFKALDNLTWPEGQAVLLTSDRALMERTNRSATIKEVPKSPYVIDTGHDNQAMRRLIDLMLGRLGYDRGAGNELKALFEVKPRAGHSVLKPDPWAIDA
jgi:hypothetical protein